MRLPPIDYYAPRSLKEAFTLLEEKNALPFAGGTDLIIKLRSRFLNEGDTKEYVLVDIKKLEGLRGIKDEGDYITIGSTTLLSDVASNPLVEEYFPALKQAVLSMGSFQLRNRATIGGNICNAAPCADSVPPLLIHNATLILIGKNGEREIPLERFLINAYKTDLRRGEILKEIRLRKERGKEFFVKLARRNALNKARMNFAVYLEMNGKGIIELIRFSAGSITPVPIRFRDVENLLLGKKPSDKLFEIAGNMLVERMIKVSGVRWSTPYKSVAVKNLTKRVLREVTK